jgi:hypothetical protein
MSRCTTCDYLSREVRAILLSYLSSLQLSPGDSHSNEVLTSLDARLDARKREIARHQMECLALRRTRPIQ